MKLGPAILVALLMGCGGDDVHDTGPCDSSWSSMFPAGATLTCEDACRVYIEPKGVACAPTCDATYAFNGVLGCCKSSQTSSGAYEVRFDVCN